MRFKLLHSCSCVWLVAALLYGGVPAVASPPGPEEPSEEAPAEPAASYAHVALLLPTNSSAFGPSAEAVKNGFLAAAKLHRKAQLPIRLYPMGDDPQGAVTTYRAAVAAGARLAVGPLTRNGVTALVGAGSIPVPTLALNVPESARALPPDFYILSLHIEDDARQVARLAAHEGRTSAVTVFSETPLSRRIQQAFVEEFTRSGGRHVAEHAFASDRTQLTQIRQAVSRSGADMVFLALDFHRARAVRPYLGALSLYATSHVFPGSIGPLTGHDLAQVRFMDMPWLLQPDHPAVMVYQRSEPRANLDLERLYALGIDAFRAAQALLEGRRETIDGVTGRLILGEHRHYVRELIRAQFIDGKLAVHTDRP
jgi:outer membrane PBP1 activator LpoA protein